MISENETEVYKQSPVDYKSWDHADLVSYHFITEQRLQLIFDQMFEFEQLEERSRCSIPKYIDNMSKSITDFPSILIISVRVSLISLLRALI